MSTDHIFYVVHSRLRKEYLSRISWSLGVVTCCCRTTPHSAASPMQPRCGRLRLPWCDGQLYCAAGLMVLEEGQLYCAAGLMVLE